MSKKLKIKALLFVVASIWGYNLYKAYLNYQSESILDEQSDYISQNLFAPQSFYKDTFELELPDRDPFLDSKVRTTYQNVNLDAKHDKPGNTRVRPIVQKVKPEVAVKWPSIKYLGFVKNHDKSNALCLLQINGSLKRLAEGDNVLGVHVSTAYRDSVQVVFNQQSKTILKG